MAGCDNCYFKSKAIENRGPEDSPFVIVGESPGIMEVFHGKPFIGPSGDVLNETLARVGCNVEPYITNAIACLPRQKDQERVAAACVACRSRLLADIRKHPRKLILALGNGALWSLTGDFSYKITKERGKLFPSDLSELGIIASVHPAFLLRGGGNYKQFTQDLQYASDLLEEGESAYKLPNGTHYRILETEDEVRQLVHELQFMSPQEFVASDIETEGFAFRSDKILCLGIQHKPKLATIIPHELITPKLFDNQVRWCWHNGKFDIKFLREQLGSHARVDEDTMLMSYTLNERRGIHDLDQVASDWLGSPNHKSMLNQWTKGTIIDDITGEKRKRHYGDVPRDVLYKYLALDLSDTYQLCGMLRPQIAKDPQLEKLYTRTLIPASEYLSKIEMRGMYTDTKQINKNEEELTKELDALETEFQEDAVKRGWTPGINLRSPIQLKDYLYGHLKLGSIALSTDKDTLVGLFDKTGHHSLELLTKHRDDAKAYGTYVKGLKRKIEDDNAVHTTYLLHGTATGRLASRDPNVQNIPRKPHLRGQFIPRPGYAILEVDYSQAELRSLAQLSGCPDLLAIFNEGKDLHVELTIFLFGENWTREDKMAAKTVNFGIVYGREAPSIAKDPDLNKPRKTPITIAEAQSWIDGWAKRFPVAWEYIQKCRMAPLRNQTMVTCFGNKKRPGVVSREKIRDYMNESANFPHQNIASNLTVHSGIKLIDPLRYYYDTWIINTVHDCLVTETPFDITKPEESKARVLEIAKFMTDTMEEVPVEWGLTKVPFKAEPEFGWRWGNVLKFKEIDELYEGRFENVPDHIAAH